MCAGKQVRPATCEVPAWDQERLRGWLLLSGLHERGYDGSQDEATGEAGSAGQELQDVIRVIVESPYAGDVELNLRYLRACMRDCLLRQEAPYASHALYTQEGVLDDLIPEERELGIQAGFLWRIAADKTVVYQDLGISKGMQYGIEHAERTNCPIEYRNLSGWTGPWVKFARPPGA